MLKDDDMSYSAQLFDILLPYPGKDNRRVRVYVPEREETERLPVIYMTDGQNLFDEESGTWGCWHTRETVEAQRAATGKAAVIVGIHNDTVWRDNELTPGSIGKVISPQEMDNFTTAEGEIFDSFVVNTVMPYIEANFPVQTGRENTAFCGSSSGGLQSFFTVLSHPDRFSMAGVFSPAFLLYSTDDMRRWLFDRIGAVLPYLYLYTGAGDDLERKIFDSTEAVYDILSECYPPELMNEVILFENAHNEAAWQGVFQDFLFTFLSRTA